MIKTPRVAAGATENETSSPSALVNWTCRGCGTPIRASARDATRQTTCPKCGARQMVPNLPDATARPAPTSRVSCDADRPRLDGRAAMIFAVVVVAAALGMTSLLFREGLAHRSGVSLPQPPATARAPHAMPSTAPPSSPPVVTAGVSRTVELVPPHAAGELRLRLQALALESGSLPRDTQGEHRAALLRLRMYRCICGLPEEDLTLDERLNVEALAAADVCRRLGRLTHDPPNPGVPEGEYERARRGARSGNLAMGLATLSAAVDGWMDDSDDDNVRVLGHRRWCLNPALRRVGFGRSERWSVMWAHDSSGTARLAMPAICFPPPGVVPIDMFRPHYAWSVTLDPRRFTKPRPHAVAVTVRRLAGTADPGRTLSMELLVVETNGYGIDNCIIFRPTGLSTAVGARYRVDISGLEDHDGEAVSLGYETEFVD